MTQARRGAGGVAAGLIGGALAAVAASVCWIVPLVLVSVGVTGAWMSALTVLAPYKWLLILAALACTGYAWHAIYRVRPANGCGPGAAPQPGARYRVLVWVVSTLVLAAVVSPHLVPLLFEE